MCISHLKHISILMLNSSEIFDLHLDIVKFTTEKMNSHTQVVLDILKSFPVTESNTKNHVLLLSASIVTKLLQLFNINADPLKLNKLKV